MSGLFVCERKSCRNMSVDVYPPSSLQFGCRCDTHHRFSGGACDNLGRSPEGMVCLPQAFEPLLVARSPILLPSQLISESVHSRLARSFSAQREKIQCL
jgi:hypothetical protein